MKKNLSLLCALSVVGALQAVEGQQKPSEPKGWFDRVDAITEVIQKYPYLSKGEKLLLKISKKVGLLFEYGEREVRCSLRRRMTPGQRFDAMTELETYTREVYADVWHELKNAESLEDVATIAPVYAHAYALPVASVCLAIANWRRALIHVPMLVGSAYGTRKARAFCGEYTNNS